MAPPFWNFYENVSVFVGPSVPFHADTLCTAEKQMRATSETKMLNMMTFVDSRSNLEKRERIDFDLQQPKRRL